MRSNTTLSGHCVFNAKIDSLVLTMHKTLENDWLTYVQNILQPSFMGSFDFVGICLQYPYHNPAVLQLTGICHHLTIVIIGKQQSESNTSSTSTRLRVDPGAVSKSVSV